MDFDNLKKSVMALGMLAFILATLIIANNALSRGILDSVSVTTVANESHTLSGTTYVYLPKTYVLGVDSVLVNTTGGNLGTFASLTLKTHYNVTNVFSEEALGIIAPAYNTNKSLVTYRYKNIESSYAGNITKQGAEGLLNTTSYFPTIGILMGIAVLIFVVISAFYMLRN